jgi:hypothetical protein
MLLRKYTHVRMYMRTHKNPHALIPPHSLSHTQVLDSRQVADGNAPGGKRGMRLSDFMNHPIARFCELTEAEIFALRFYTTAGFKGINWQEFLKSPLYSGFTLRNIYVIYMPGHLLLRMVSGPSGTKTGGLKGSLIGSQSSSGFFQEPSRNCEPMLQTVTALKNLSSSFAA